MTNPIGNRPLQTWIANALTIAQDSQALQGLIATIQRTQEWDGQPAAAYTIIGERDATVSGVTYGSGILTDVVEFPLGVTFAYPELNGTEPLEVVSSSPNDAAAGSNARQVRITGLDAAGNIQTTTATLNGTEPVSLGAVRYQAIWWMAVIAVGATPVAAGNIDLRITAGSTIVERVSASGNQSLSGRFTVPTGYTGYVTEFAAGNDAIVQRVRLRATVERGKREVLSGIYHFKNEILLGASSNGMREIPFEVVPALADVKMSTISAATNQGRVSAEFTIIIRRNDT